MTIADRSSGIVQNITAIKDHPGPVIHSTLIQLCSMQDFATACTNDCVDDEVWLVQLRMSDPVLDSIPLLGKGSDHPKINAILNDFPDVLVSELPSGLPKERRAIDGSIDEHTIELDPTSKQYAAQPRPLTVEEDTELRRLLDELLTKGWIVPSLSPHAAPVVFVRKKPVPITGKSTLRMCVSYVRLHKATFDKIAYRLPRITSLLEKVTKAKYFSKIDLVSGYWQVPVTLSELPKTAFTTPYGSYEFKVMPFGSCGAASTFRYLMDSVFAKDVKINDKVFKFADFVASYMDVTCICSDTADEHFTHIIASSSRLRQFGLYAKPSKCEWLQTSILFLGHQTTCHGRMADPDRVNALQTWPAPTNRSELRSLLETFGFWRTYIKDYAAIVSCMTAFTSDKIRWNWTYEHDKALLDLKTALHESPVLIAPRSDLPFVLVTDASEFAIGACLEQCVVSGGVRRPVAFLSHALSPTERKYPVYSKNC
jgi:hypothetical protein